MAHAPVAIICGVCFSVRKCRHRPDFCGCGARFERDRYAMLEVVVERVGTTFTNWMQTRFVGSWTTRERDALLGDLAEDERELRLVDAGEKGP